MYNTEVFNELIVTIIRGLLIPFVPVVTVFLTALIKKMTEDISNQLKDAEFLKYTHTAENIINTAVTAVYQTYIDHILKKRIVLTDDEMQIAFNMIKEKSIEILSDTVRDELSKKYTDLDKWLENKIVCSSNPEMIKIIGSENNIGVEVMLCG